jgi:magnesium transporter
LDSIVDSFFPFLEEVEREVVGIEEFVFSESRETASRLISRITANPVKSAFDVDQVQVINEKTLPGEKEEGATRVLPRPWTTRLLLAASVVIHWLRRLKISLRRISASGPSSDADLNSAAITSPLRRMARTRRLVTSLGRLLATKSEVITQLRKRLLSSTQSGLGSWGEKGDEVDVAIYMGDVQGLYFPGLLSRECRA